MNTILLLFLAIAPAAVLMVLIYWMDRHEPESLKNILMAMLIGALSIIPAIIIEVGFGSMPIFLLPGLAGPFYESFLLVAPTEEFVKFFFIYLYIRKKPFYNASYDGIVYFGAGALGFALLENIFYVFHNGFSVGVLRAFTSIPIHAFCGIIIGYHAGLARFSDQRRSKRLIAIGLLLAYLTHALYNTLVLADSLLTLFFIPLVAVVYFAIYKVLHRGRQQSIPKNPEGHISTELVGSHSSSAPLVALSDQSPVFLGMTSSEESHSEELQVQPLTKARSEEIATDSDGNKYRVPKKEKWKAIISRILLTATGLVWLLVFTVGENPPNELLDLVLGMILLTIIPFMIGLLLEVSYQRSKRRKIDIVDQNKMSAGR